MDPRIRIHITQVFIVHRRHCCWSRSLSPDPDFNFFLWPWDDIGCRLVPKVCYHPALFLLPLPPPLPPMHRIPGRGTAWNDAWANTAPGPRPTPR
jgi:hypothetical protein